jgi:hypothetical protein
LVGRHERYCLAALDRFRPVERECQYCGVLLTGFDRHDSERVTAQLLCAEEVLVQDEDLKTELTCRKKSLPVRSILPRTPAGEQGEKGKSSTVRTVVINPPLTI